MHRHELVADRGLCEKSVEHAQLSITRFPSVPREVETDLADVLGVVELPDELSLLEWTRRGGSEWVQAQGDAYARVAAESHRQESESARKVGHRDDDRVRGVVESAGRVREEVEMAMSIDVGRHGGSRRRSFVDGFAACIHARISARPR